MNQARNSGWFKLTEIKMPKYTFVSTFVSQKISFQMNVNDLI